MKPLFALVGLLVLSIAASSQPHSYKDSLENFQKNYADTHEVVRGKDKDYFRFFKIDRQYCVTALFEKITDTTGFIMKTSGAKRPKYFRCGTLYFSIRKKPLTLTVYQSERLMADSSDANYLFVPFTDLSSGEKSYGGGRYLDFVLDDIKNNYLTIDFNKAYNPYCAYATGFNCPIPPAENNLPVAIEAGEMEFGKKH